MSVGVDAVSNAADAGIVAVGQKVPHLGFVVFRDPVVASGGHLGDDLRSLQWLSRSPKEVVDGSAQ